MVGGWGQRSIQPAGTEGFYNNPQDDGLIIYIWIKGADINLVAIVSLPGLFFLFFFRMEKRQSTLSLKCKSFNYSTEERQRFI